MEKIFLDANILFSAAYKSTRIRELWSLNNISLISSSYAVIETERNLARLRGENINIFHELLAKMTVIEVPSLITLIPETINLVEKDSPILTGAIFANCDYLLTGDVKHFGHLFNQTIKGVTILGVAEYFRLKNI
jgi:predicted nucleic acid-binding protein